MTKTCLSSLGIRFLEEEHLKPYECISLAKGADRRGRHLGTCPKCLSMPLTWHSSASSGAALGALRDLGCDDEPRNLPSPRVLAWLHYGSALPLYYSLCFLAEAAVAEGLQRLESKVAVSLTMLSQKVKCALGKHKIPRRKSFQLSGKYYKKQGKY